MICFIEKPLLNQSNDCYGRLYHIFATNDDDAQMVLNQIVVDVIGEDYYYANRDVWNQIRFEFVVNEDKVKLAELIADCVKE